MKYLLLLITATFLFSGCTSSTYSDSEYIDESTIAEYQDCIDELNDNMTQANNAIDDATGNLEDGEFSDGMSQLEDARYYTEQHCDI